MRETQGRSFLRLPLVVAVVVGVVDGRTEGGAKDGPGTPQKRKALRQPMVSPRMPPTA